MPHLAALLVTLLLVQWGQGASACLAALRLDPAGVICHAGDDPPSGGDQHAGLACPHCAPLPPALAAAPPMLPHSGAAVVAVAAALPSHAAAPPVRREAAHPPRGPPVLA